ncbi:hypothetical protein H9L21_06165 [Aeromicrobium senzhongii]|uniref:Uncharacterized protein n=1 Tax=Aeromicrobium senzhongii TaxID=2663859 RepID=A0ABX6SW76_9ACTN|nr:hypothetical protein [Aeromicrobium senzhongii]MTB87449.1 hypothetical protein [Aeromicrobium senzhongii]QNL95497.1 hypothetical protein H9L21_06165 [Aeromicrobium senzhongii]
MSVVRGSHVRSSRLWVVAVATALTLAACSDSPDEEPAPSPSSPSATATSSPTATPTTESPTTPAPEALPPLAELVVSPGRVGPAAAGMTRDEALATGLFEADAPVRGEDCGRVAPLAWKPDYASSLDVLAQEDGTIVSLGVRGEQPRTADGLGVGSTLRQVSGVHETAELTEAGYGQTGVLVTDGDRWLGYLFDADPESVGPNDEVVLVEVTQGTKPDLMRDGC